MAPTLAFAVLSGALIAGDPDMEWSTDSQPASLPVEVSPAPAPPPASAREPLEAEPTLSQVVPTRSPLDKNFRLALELGFAASPSSMGQLGGAVELDWYALRFLRLQASIGGSWIPIQSPYVDGVESRGAMKILGGVDGVLPFTWGELFVGLQSGAAYTSVAPYYGYGDCFDCGGFGGYSRWDWAPAARIRGGLEVTLARPLVVGFDVGYSLFAQQYNEVHWAEAHARIGFAF